MSSVLKAVAVMVDTITATALLLSLYMAKAIVEAAIKILEILASSSS